MQRTTLIATALCLTIAASFLAPKHKYSGAAILSSLDIPAAFADWTSEDVSAQLDLNDDRYNFISDVFARVYTNSSGQQLLFLILDAGNFHNPKKCFSSSGFQVKELPDMEFYTDATTIRANALYMAKEPSGLFLYYWLCLDKTIVNWTGQKIRELWTSLLNKKKAGLMVRIEIHGPEQARFRARALGQSFIRALSSELPPEQQDYIFGAGPE